MKGTGEKCETSQGSVTITNCQCVEKPHNSLERDYNKFRESVKRWVPNIMIILILFQIYPIFL